MTKEMPEYDSLTLLKYAKIELESHYRMVDGKEIKKDGLHISGHPLVEVIKHHLKSQEIDDAPVGFAVGMSLTGHAASIAEQLIERSRK